MMDNKQLDFQKLHEFAEKAEEKRIIKENRDNKARKALDEGKIKLSEYLEIINQK